MTKDISTLYPMMKSLKVVFFGNESLATGVESNPLVLKALVDNGYDVCAVVVHERQSTSRKSKKVATMEYAAGQNIPLYNPGKPIEIVGELRAMKADVGVLVAYGRIIPQEIIDIFPHGIINLHPSLLPKLRGSTPIESAILDGLSATGVSIMSLTAGMDSGPIYEQKTIDIGQHEAKLILTERLHSAGAQMMIDVLAKLDDAPATDQNGDKATYTVQIRKSDGQIDWRKSAERIEREIRAYSVWPKSTAQFGDIEVAILKAHTIEVDGSEHTPGKIILSDDESKLAVITGQGYICVEVLRPAGKNAMKIGEFINGYKQKLGL
jgi:methionyl-tRNA formyltransferase